MELHNSEIFHSKQKLQFQLEKKDSHIALLEEELKEANDALVEKDEFAKALELDLEHALTQLQRLKNRHTDKQFS